MRRFATIAVALIAILACVLFIPPKAHAASSVTAQLVSTDTAQSAIHVNVLPDSAFAINGSLLIVADSMRDLIRHAPVGGDLIYGAPLKPPNRRLLRYARSDSVLERVTDYSEDVDHLT
jgi:hypothetical protein